MELPKAGLKISPLLHALHNRKAMYRYHAQNDRGGTKQTIEWTDWIRAKLSEGSDVG